MSTARSANRSRPAARPRQRRRQTSRTSIAIVVVIVVVFGAALFKVSQPYMAARQQSLVNEELRQKIAQTRKETKALSRTAAQLQTDAGTEAAARQEGWRRQAETPVLMPEETPQKPQKPAEDEHQRKNK